MVFSRAGLFSRRRSAREQVNEIGEETRTRRVGYVPIDDGTDEAITRIKARLTSEGCDEIIAGDNASLATLGEGDFLVIGDLGHFGHPLPELVDLLNEFTRRGVRLRSLDDGIDTSLPEAAPALALISALATVSRAQPPATPLPRPVKPGRKPKLNAQQVRIATALIDAGESRKSVARTLGVSLPTLRHALRRHGADGKG